jgi:hypothetical protein
MISNRCQSAALPVLRVNDLLTVFPLGSGSSFLLWCQSVGGVCEGCVYFLTASQTLYRVLSYLTKEI